MEKMEKNAKYLTLFDLFKGTVHLFGYLRVN